jgi:hypothetical protein
VPSGRAMNHPGHRRLHGSPDALRVHRCLGMCCADVPGGTTGISVACGQYRWPPARCACCRGPGRGRRGSGEPRDPEWFQEDFHALLKQLRRGEIHPVVAERLPLSDARRAYILTGKDGPDGVRRAPRQRPGRARPDRTSADDGVEHQRVEPLGPVSDRCRYTWTGHPGPIHIDLSGFQNSVIGLRGEDRPNTADAGSKAAAMRCVAARIGSRRGSPLSNRSSGWRRPVTHVAP